MDSIGYETADFSTTIQDKANTAFKSNSSLASRKSIKKKILSFTASINVKDNETVRPFDKEDIQSASKTSNIKVKDAYFGSKTKKIKIAEASSEIKTQNAIAKKVSIYDKNSSLLRASSNTSNFASEIKRENSKGSYVRATLKKRQGVREDSKKLKTKIFEIHLENRNKTSEKFNNFLRTFGIKICMDSIVKLKEKKLQSIYKKATSIDFDLIEKEIREYFVKHNKLWHERAERLAFKLLFN